MPVSTAPSPTVPPSVPAGPPARRGTPFTRRIRTALGLAAAGITLVAASGCAASVAQNTASVDTGESVPWGAGPEEYRAALADMEPTTLTFQAGTASGESHTGKRELAFAENIEEWSGGKIRVETVFGQAIAPYDEVTEGVADGRIDIGVEIPIYTPTKYPNINALVDLSTSVKGDPYFSEMVTTTAMQEVAWDHGAIISDYEEKGVDVLVPVEFEFSNALLCSEPRTSTEDFAGSMIRVGSKADVAIVKALGAVPVSMHYPETYEALQRNTMDCTFAGLKIAQTYGFYDAAPYVVFPQEKSFVRSPTSMIAGHGFRQLPLAARQMIFDLTMHRYAQHIEASVAFNDDSMEDIAASGGEVLRLEADAEAALEVANAELADRVDGLQSLDGSALASDLEAAVTKWEGIARDAGYAEIHDHADLVGDSAAAVDGMPIAKALYEDVYLDLRPGAGV